MPGNTVRFFTYFYSLSIFLVGTGLGVYFWDTVHLPFQNPENVIGPLSMEGLNPNNDIVRFVLFLLLPPLLLLITWKPVTAKRNIRVVPCTRHHTRTNHFWWLIILLTCITALNTPTYHASGPFDTFHEGETLGSAISLLEGKKPYRDVVFSHGVFHDPLRSIIAIRYFDNPIGAARAVTSLLKVLTFLLLGFYLVRLYDNDIPWILALYFFLFFGLSEETFILLPRDWICYLYLILLSFVPKLPRPAQETSKTAAMSFFLALLPVLAFAFTIDRAFYISALYMLLLPVLALVFFRKAPHRKAFLLGTLMGAAAGLLLLTVLLQGAVKEFAYFVFVHVPKTKEFADGLAYPIMTPRFLTMAVLLSGSAFWLSLHCISRLRGRKQHVLYFLGFCKQYFNIIALFFLALFCFRNGLGRSDEEHLAYSSFLPILLCLTIVIRCYLARWFQQFPYKILQLILVSAAILYSASMLGSVFSKDSITANFPIQTKDSAFIPQEYADTITFLKKHINDHETFVTLTNEASWYYFINQACPTRFPLVWFALSHKNQLAFIESLRTEQVHYILVRNSHWANNIDDIPNQRRLPLLFSYVEEHFHPLVTIDGNEIWKRNR